MGSRRSNRMGYFHVRTPGPGTRARPLAPALLAVLALAVPALPSLAEDDDDFTIEEILTTPIENLMDISVTTVAGTKKSWSKSPAALHVITGEDIRRSGHRTIADALRMVPGVFVGSTSAHGWVVGARGFSGGLANKTLVLIDGRAVYDPLFGGTFWDVQDLPLDTVDRLEVILGPGATLWGANAVNGVINVITKSAEDTQGGYVKAGGGTEERGFGSARYGGKLSERGWYRVWGKYFNRDDYVTTSGDSAHDEWDMGHGGFRVDLDGDENTTFTLQGDGYSLDFDESVNVPVPDQHLQFTERVDDGKASGGNLLFRMSRATGESSGWSLQSYYDRTDRTQTAEFKVERDTADVDFRHHVSIGRHELHWGLGYRYSGDETDPSLGGIISYDPRSRDLHSFSAFVQNTITLIPERLFAMLGSKLGHNNFSGLEVQPSGRLWWILDDDKMLWTAVSRPVRVPSRTELDSTITFGVVDTGLAQGGAASGVFAPVGVIGDDDLEAEKLVAYEIGYRQEITPRLMFDVALFYNDYSRLIFVPQTTFGTWNDDGSGETYGGELTTRWRATDAWTLEGSYSYVGVQIHGPILPQDEGNTPENQLKLLSSWDVTSAFELDTAIYYVDRVPTVDADSYVRIDAGVTWRPIPALDLALRGQNLFENRHREASSTIQVQRAGYLELTWRF